MSVGDLEDLASRWRRARRAAVESVIGPTLDGASDDERFACAAEVDEAELHRRLFENGAKLGAGFARLRGQPVTMAELRELLPRLGVPCLHGRDWAPLRDEPGWRARRGPCGQGAGVGACDAWREAIDGLVVGLTGALRHTRTASFGHGQPECVDVLYENPEGEARYGELPDALVPALEAVQRFVRRFRAADVRFLGVSEGVLLYQLELTGCGEAEHARAVVERLLEQKLPGQPVRELSPRQVLDPSSPGDQHP
jgi:hypothetical protein